ncbi:MAG: hypothetical protein ACE5JN_15275 [Candidatus Methylomirabilia bacterium]
MNNDEWKEDEADHRGSRTYANVLITLGATLWVVAVAGAATLLYLNLQGGAASEVISSRQLGQYSARWIMSAFMLLGVLAGGILGAPLIVGGQLIKIFLGQRESLLALRKQTELLASQLDQLELGRASAHARAAPEHMGRGSRPSIEALEARGVLFEFLNDYDRLRNRAGTAERECERLRGLLFKSERLHVRAEEAERESERLREEVRQLRAETESYRREREEIADVFSKSVDSLSQLVNEALGRLRGQRA